MADAALQRLDEGLHDLAKKIRELQGWDEQWEEQRKNDDPLAAELEILLNPSSLFQEYIYAMQLMTVIAKAGLLYAEYFGVDPKHLQKIELNGNS